MTDSFMKSIPLQTILEPRKVEIDERGVKVKVELHPAGRASMNGGNVFRTHFSAGYLQPELDALMNKVAELAGESIEETAIYNTEEDDGTD